MLFVLVVVLLFLLVLNVVNSILVKEWFIFLYIMIVRIILEVLINVLVMINILFIIIKLVVLVVNLENEFNREIIIGILLLLMGIINIIFNIRDIFINVKNIGKLNGVIYRYILVIINLLNNRVLKGCCNGKVIGELFIIFCSFVKVIKELVKVILLINIFNNVVIVVGSGGDWVVVRNC